MRSMGRETTSSLQTPWLDLLRYCCTVSPSLITTSTNLKKGRNWHQESIRGMVVLFTLFKLFYEMDLSILDLELFIVILKGYQVENV